MTDAATWSAPATYAVALAASGLLAVALVPSFGAFSVLALALVLAGLLLVAALLLEQLRLHRSAGSAPGAATADGPPTVLVPAVLWAVIFSMAFAAYADPLLITYPEAQWRVGRAAQVALLLVLTTYLPALLVPRWVEPPVLRHVRVAVLAVLVLLAGWDVLRASPAPGIDVWAFQQAGAGALLEGRNPYPEVSVPDTGPAGGVVPYVYWPGQLLATLPAFALGGDVRYAMLTAVVVAGLCLRALTHRSGAAPLLQDAPLLFLWCAPKLFYVVQLSWSEPIPLALLCAAVTAQAFRRPWLAAALTGAAVSSKQTIVLLAPVLLLGLRSSLRQVLLAVAVPFTVLLVFGLWDPRALFDATVVFVAELPSRQDSLTLLNWWSLRFGVVVPDVLGPLVIVAATAAVARAARTRASLPLATTGAALCATALFVLGRLAFANYYFLASGLCALAAAAALHARGEDAASLRE